MPYRIRNFSTKIFETISPPIKSPKNTVLNWKEEEKINWIEMIQNVLCCFFIWWPTPLLMYSVSSNLILKNNYGARGNASSRGLTGWKFDSLFQFVLIALATFRIYINCALPRIPKTRLEGLRKYLFVPPEKRGWRYRANANIRRGKPWWMCWNL